MEKCDQRGLAGTIGTQQGKNLAPRNLQIDTLQELEGVWEADGYARLFYINGEQLQFYQVSKTHCQLMMDIPLEGFLKPIDRIGFPDQNKT